MIETAVLGIEIEMVEEIDETIVGKGELIRNSIINNTVHNNSILFLY